MPLTATISHVVNDGTVDEYGTPGESVSTTSAKCWLWQNSRAEDNQSQAVQQESFSLGLPPDVELDGGDRVEIDGIAYEVDGPPWKATNARTGEVSHIEATVKRAGT